MAETTLSAYPLPRERNLILGSLLILAAAAWGLAHLASRDNGRGDEPDDGDERPAVDRALDRHDDRDHVPHGGRR